MKHEEFFDSRSPCVGTRQPEQLHAIDPNGTEITDVKASTQFVLGAQLRIGSAMWGFEQRWFSFLGDTREYILAGASNTSTPSYFCMSIGWKF